MYFICRLLILYFCLFIPLATAGIRVLVNNQNEGTLSLPFDGDNPCLTSESLQAWGLKSKLIRHLQWNRAGCMTMTSAKLYGVRLHWRPDVQTLVLEVAEKDMRAQTGGASPDRWDDGINAWFTNYRLNANQGRAQYAWETAGTDGTLTLNNGLNLGAWRLRNRNTFWRLRSGQTGQYSDHLSLWRSLRGLRSQMTLGYGTTSSDLFEGMSFQGMALASDEAMYPDIQHSYRPVINGFARTQAEVSIRQNGELFYRIHVRPGPFSITDFYPQDKQGELELTVEESDGTERTRTLPYSTLPNLQQQGVTSYALAAGRYQPEHGISREKTPFWQASFTRGVTASASVFSGIQQGSHYLAQVYGVGDNLGSWGALSGDISHAFYSVGGKKQSGQVGRLRYAKEFFDWSTSLNAQLQWYPPGSQYRSLEEKVNADYAFDHGWGDSTTQRALTTHLEFNMDINEDSTVSLSWDSLTARGKSSDSDSFSLSLNGSWQDIDGSVYLSHNHDEDLPPEIAMGVNISIPLSGESYSTNLGYVGNYSNRENSSHGVDLYGSALKDYSLTYDVTAQHTQHQSDGLSANLGYLYNAGDTHISLVHSGKQQDLHLDTSGSVVLDSEGITLGQSLSDTVALVSAGGRAGVSFYNQYATTTDRQGRLLVNYLDPWRVNEITVNTFDLPSNLSFSEDAQKAIPSRGAIIRLNFQPDKVTAHKDRQE